MIKLNWEARLAIFLVALSVCIYSLKFLVLKNPGDTLNYILNSAGFLPINVLLVTIVLNKLLAIRSKRERMEKMNMVIGTFYTEIGTRLIKDIARSDPDAGRLGGSLIMGSEWDDGAFAEVQKKVAGYDYKVEVSAIDLVRFHEFLSSRRDFMLRLLENPVLL
jgi:hypothetical protein